jgi:plasmid stabilization system protein ParE
MKLRWTRRAVEDMRRCAQEIALINPRVAVEVVDRLMAQTESLRDASPTRGAQELAVAGTRLALLYRVNAKTERVEILGVTREDA